jgi:hypothetical protein
LETVLLGAGLNSTAATALRALASDRKLLISVAESAKKQLGIPAKLDPFVSDAKSLKGELQGGKAKKSVKNAAIETAVAEESVPEAEEPASDDQQG